MRLDGCCTLADLPALRQVAKFLANCTTSPGAIKVELFIAAHCGRGAPPSLQKMVTEARAKTIGTNIAHLLVHTYEVPPKALANRLRIFYHGCCATVAERDIAESGQALDFSRAEIRLVVSSSSPAAAVLLEWGRRWWEAQSPQGAVLPEPTYTRLVVDADDSVLHTYAGSSTRHWSRLRTRLRRSKDGLV